MILLLSKDKKKVKEGWVGEQVHVV